MLSICVLSLALEEATMAAARQAPVCLSMIVCDSVQLDRGSGKVTILGAFENISSTAFPARHPELAVFAELTDGRGQTPLSLKICRVTPESLDGDELFRGSLEVNFVDPRQTARLMIQVAPWIIPQAGEYRFILETEGSFVAERRIAVLQQGKPNG